VLPGPEVQQLATYIGWLMHRTLGGLQCSSTFNRDRMVVEPPTIHRRSVNRN